ncbi:MAG: helix-turn-helix domain-containing protein [candidate division NC10 bacterium]|nr:helix-turn-helix domain-containing protein [candidate division NC10 bacterium]
MRLSVEQLQERTGISKHTWRHWVKRGLLPCVKLGRLVKVTEEDLHRFIEEHRQSRGERKQD